MLRDVLAPPQDGLCPESHAVGKYFQHDRKPGLQRIGHVRKDVELAGVVRHPAEVPSVELGISSIESVASFDLESLLPKVVDHTPVAWHDVEAVLRLLRRDETINQYLRPGPGPGLLSRFGFLC